MGQRKRKLWLGTEVIDHKYYRSEDPKYGQPFQIVAIQLESIEKEKFTGWIEDGEIPFGGGVIDFSDYLKKIRKVGENDREVKKMKDKISDDICKDLNKLFEMCSITVTRVKDVVALKVHYLGEPKGKYQIL
jgi:hypothetical protein